MIVILLKMLLLSLFLLLLLFYSCYFYCYSSYYYYYWISSAKFGLVPLPNFPLPTSPPPSRLDSGRCQWWVSFALYRRPGPPHRGLTFKPQLGVGQNCSNLQQVLVILRINHPCHPEPSNFRIWNPDTWPISSCEFLGIYCQDKQLMPLFSPFSKSTRC